MQTYQRGALEVGGARNDDNLGRRLQPAYLPNDEGDKILRSDWNNLLRRGGTSIGPRTADTRSSTSRDKHELST